MVPSLPLWLNVPPIPKLLLRFAAWLLSRVESSMFSIKPAPKVGVGIRKMMLLTCWAALKLGCGKLQEPASERPVTVNKFSTPPFGALKLGVPLELKKNGKRASRVGPLALIKYGVVSRGATPLLVNWNCGLTAGPVPPMAGWVWQELQLFELKRGPRPLAVPSTSWKRARPSLKNARIPGLSFA